MNITRFTGNDDNLLKEIREDDRDDDIDKDSNETKRKVNRSRRKIIFGIFYRPHDMAELAGPGGIGPSSETQGQLVGSIKCSW